MNLDIYKNEVFLPKQQTRKNARKTVTYTRKGVFIYQGKKLAETISYLDVSRIQINLSQSPNIRQFFGTYERLKDKNALPKVKVYDIELLDNNGLQLINWVVVGEDELNSALFIMTIDHPHLRDSIFEFRPEEALLEWIEEKEGFYYANRDLYSKSRQELYFTTLLKALARVLVLTLTASLLCLSSGRITVTTYNMIMIFLIFFGGFGVFGFVIHLWYYFSLTHYLPE